MRVGLVCPYSFDVPGGVQNHIRDLSLALGRRGHDVSVLAPGEMQVDVAGQLELVGKTVAVPYNGSVARVAFGPRVAARTGRWLRRGEFDLVHVHEPLAPSVSLLALWACDQPVVATFHTANLRSRTMAALSSVIRPSLEKVSARIAVSETARSTLVNQLGGEPVVIPNGLFCDSFAAAERHSVWTQPGPVLAFLGRIDEPRKGLSVLMEAFDIVAAAVPGCRLLVAGAGDWPEQLSEQARGQVVFLGLISDEDRVRLLRSATVYVAPQTMGESFGIVLVEAMAAGTAVVASDLPAFGAVLDDGRTGRLFRTGDPVDLARVIIEVVSSPADRIALERRASAVVRRYDWSRVTDELLAVYETVLHEPAGRTR